MDKGKKVMIIAGIALLCVLILCAVGIFFFVKEDTAPTAGNEPESSVEPETPVDSEPEDAILEPAQKGAWYGGAVDTEQVYNVNTPEECYQKALEREAKAYSHRSDTHPDPNWKNSCSLLIDGFDPNKKHPDPQSNPVHTVGCTFPEDTIEKGCRS